MRMRDVAVLLVLTVWGSAAHAQSSFNLEKLRDKHTLNNEEVRQMFRTLGISNQFAEPMGVKFKSTAENVGCQGECSVQVFLLPRPSGDGVGNVVVISRALDMDLHRVLLFRNDSNNGSQLVDYFDLEERLYDFPRISSISSGGKRWLTVSMWPHCGTGCGLHYTDWFELKGGKSQRVLRVPDSGHDGNVNPGIDYETRFVRARQSAKNTTLEFIYHLTVIPGFSSQVDDLELWEDESVVRFSQTDQQPLFRLDAIGSELS